MSKVAEAAPEADSIDLTYVNPFTPLFRFIKVEKQILRSRFVFSVLGAALARKNSTSDRDQAEVDRSTEILRRPLFLGSEKD